MGDCIELLTHTFVGIWKEYVLAWCCRRFLNYFLHADFCLSEVVKKIPFRSFGNLEISSFSVDYQVLNLNNGIGISTDIVE